MVRDADGLKALVESHKKAFAQRHRKMKKSPFELAMAFTLKAEGKFTIDDGGPTMMGVTQHVYDAYRMRNHEPVRSVKQIDYAEVENIMHSEYWGPARCDEMSTRLAICAFDWSFNHGVLGAIQTLQGCLGITADGVFGAQTLAAVKAAGVDLVARFLDARRAWYRQAAKENPAKFAQYLDGWLKRVDQLEMYLDEVA